MKTKEIFAEILLSILVATIIGGGFYLRQKKHYSGNNCEIYISNNLPLNIDPNNKG